jgi:hypothetical protein
LLAALSKFLPSIKPGYAVVFLAKKKLIGQSYNQVKSQMARVLTTAGLQ